MTQIIFKSQPVLDIRVGHIARELILKEGLQAQHVDVIPGAAGGPKGIGIQGLDQAIFADFLAQSPKKRLLIGSSIGSWRFASILAWGAKHGTERLAQAYTELSFHKKMTPNDVSQICQDMLCHLVQGQEQKIVDHPDYHLGVLSVQAQHIFKSDHRIALLASMLGIVGTTAIARKHSKWFMQRVISQPHSEYCFQLSEDDFKTHYQTLTKDNLIDWLMASASIPGVMSAIKDIPNAPKGYYRDGGLIDYHIDLPFNSQGLVLYPHFTNQIIPGWFDKFFNRNANPNNQARTVLISPSQAYLDKLPQGRLPDRKDFVQKGLSQTERVKMWQQCIAESHRLGDAFLELVEKQNFPDYFQTL